jgi:hypothetical protein
MGYIKGEDREQNTQFPKNIEDYITANNPVRIIIGRVTDGTKYCMCWISN